MPVKGAKRSIICDLEKGQFEFISNSIYNILAVHRETPLKEIKKIYGEKIVRQLNPLVDKDIIFFTDEPHLFPAFNLEWQSPYLITNAIIDVNFDSHHDFELIGANLFEVGCQHIQVRCYSEISLDNLLNSLDKLLSYEFKSLDLILHYSSDIKFSDYTHMLNRYAELFNIIIHSSNNSNITQLESGANLIEITDCITSHEFCGIIHPSLFSINTDTLLEAINYNSCLNAKISIDVNGEIKNCPSMSVSYGHIKTSSLKNVLAQTDFSKYWKIKKDDVLVCKDCEFRYICTDCRAFINNPNNLISKPSKCKYDPYSAKWEAE